MYQGKLPGKQKHRVKLYGWLFRIHLSEQLPPPVFALLLPEEPDYARLSINREPAWWARVIRTEEEGWR
jgi:hypothetical protein